MEARSSCPFSLVKNLKHGGKRKGAGRPPEADPRQPFPFRIKASLIEKAKRLGRDRIEAMIKRAQGK